MLHGIEVRERIMSARKNGMQISKISEVCQVGERTVYRILKQELEAIRELILSMPDITLEQIKEELGLTMGLPRSAI